MDYRPEYYRKRKELKEAEIKLLKEIQAMPAVQKAAALPTTGLQGSERKILRLSARESAGLPLWNEKDA